MSEPLEIGTRVVVTDAEDSMYQGQPGTVSDYWSARFNDIGFGVLDYPYPYFVRLDQAPDDEHLFATDELSVEGS